MLSIVRRLRYKTFAAVVSGLLVSSSLAQAQAGLYVYVPNRSSNNVGVLLTNADGTLTFLTSVSVGTLPAYAVVSNDNRFAYVTSATAGTVSVISTATQTVIQVIGCGPGATDLAFSPNGQRLYVANNTSAPGGDAIHGFAVETATGLLTPHVTISTGALTQPRTIEVVPDGSSLWVVNQAANSVHLISLNTNSILATIPVGLQPEGAVLTPDGSLLFVANTSAPSISVIDTAARGVIATLPAASPLGMATRPDGRFVYAGNLSNNFVSQYNVTSLTGLVPRDVASGTNSGFVAISPNGAFAYVSNRGDNTVSQFSVNPSTGVLTPIGTPITSGGTAPFGLGMQRRYAPATAPGPIPPNSGRPSAPRGVSVKRNNLALVVDFSPPQIPNIPDPNDLNYRVYVDTAEGYRVAIADARSSGVLIQNVKNEQAYYVSVTAINGFGEGESSTVLVAAPDWAFYPKDKDGRPCPSPQPCQ